MASVTFEVDTDIVGAPTINMVIKDDDGTVLSTTPAELSVASQSDSNIVTTYFTALDTFISNLPNTPIPSSTIEQCQTLVSQLQVAANAVNNHLSYLFAQQNSSQNGL